MDDLDWTGLRRRQSAKFDCDLNQTKTFGNAELLLVTCKVNMEMVLKCNVKSRIEKVIFEKVQKLEKTKSQFQN